jgi:hypothetical protein
MLHVIQSTLVTLNQFLTAGVAITAFSLLLYALSFNLRDHVARTFALIMTCVMIVFVGDAIASTAVDSAILEFLLRLEWVGITFLPAVYFHFSDAVLSTTGRPSRWRRRLLVRICYLISTVFLISLPFELLVGPLVENVAPAAHLERTWVTLLFTLYYLIVMGLVVINLVRAYRRTISRVSRRRMGYLLIGSLAPALGSYPYLLFGSGFAARHTLIFWLVAVLSNLVVLVLLIVMAYAVAFFGVAWPDRVVKRRLAKWLMRGPVAASTVLVITTLVRRAGERMGMAYWAAAPIVMVASFLLIQHLITLIAPIWERWLFHGRDRQDIDLMQSVEARLLTTGDLRQFLEALLAAVCDRLQAELAFVVGLAGEDDHLWVTVGNATILEKEELTDKILVEANNHEAKTGIYRWGEFWITPLYPQRTQEGLLLGIMGAMQDETHGLEEEDRAALLNLAEKAALALEDRVIQQQVFASLEELAPQVDMIQRLRAASRYNSGASLANGFPVIPVLEDQSDLEKWVKDALTHFWGGPKLTRNPLLGLQVVQQSVSEHQDNPSNALRAILRKGVERVRPEGERRFTGEWILYNILELKFIESKSVREVAMRLSMSEADLYRKQRVAIEAVANAIIEMEKEAAGEEDGAEHTG